MNTPVDFSRTLAELGDLAELRGSGDHAAELRRAARIAGSLAPGDALLQHPDLGEWVRRRLREVADLGEDAAFRAARARIPNLLRLLLHESVVSVADAVVLVRQLGILTAADLEIALEEGRAAAVLGDPFAARLQQAIDAIAPAREQIPLGRAWDLLDAILSAMPGAVPHLAPLIPAGDVRRSEPLVSGLVLVGRAPDPAAAIEAICAIREFDDVRHRGPRRAIVVYKSVEVDVRMATLEDHGTVLFRATGSRAHIAAVHRRRPLPRLAAREEDVYTHAGLTFVEPELRHHEGEIEAAAAKSLPALVSRDDIRGDLHMHTTYSDGRDTLAAMVAASAALGYEYIAITDHSERAAASRTLSLDQLARQRDELARVREQFPRMTILHGVEVDILPDGRLDFPDAVLEELDIVLASLHDAAGHDPRTLTRRCIEAIRHPLVNVITHPANRLVGRRAGYELDFEAVFAAAVETGTALEIDGAPSHLDLEGALARAAVAAGVTVTIDSDCHRAAALDRQMRLGVGTARRGWVEPRHVLNSRGVEDVRAFVLAKRARRG